VKRREGRDKKIGPVAQMGERCMKRKEGCEKKIGLAAQMEERCVKRKKKGVNGKSHVFANPNWLG